MSGILSCHLIFNNFLKQLKWKWLSLFAWRWSVLCIFAITAAGVVPCGGPKKSPRTSSIVQIIFSFWSEIKEDILRNQNIIIGLDSYSNQRSIYLATF